MPPPYHMRRVIINAGPIAHLSGDGPLSGRAMSAESLVYPAGMGLVVDDHVIEKIAPTEEISSEYSGIDQKLIIDLNGDAIIPGLVDSHAHLLWDGDRSQEVRWKQQGQTYRQIAELGGGISSTVSATRKAIDSRLLQLGVERLNAALRNGTTHMEIKSGYGLDTESECRLLNIGKQLGAIENLPSLDLTWLGAHAVPPNGTIESYVEEIMADQLPAIIEQGLARSTDVFCEPGWFNLEQTEEILRAAKSGGMDLRLHIDEFSDGGGGELAAEMEVSTADHAHYTNDDARQKMHEAGVNTGFLPGTPYSMGDNYPPFKHCTEAEWNWSFASDFNPNCRILSLPFLGSVLVQRNGMDPLASLVACTRNSAETTPHPSGLTHGQIVEGGIANLNIVDGKHWEAWCLQPGHSPFKKTILEGELISH